jgi:hypothetical protein
MISFQDNFFKDLIRFIFGRLGLPYGRVLAEEDVTSIYDAQLLVVWETSEAFHAFGIEGLGCPGRP